MSILASLIENGVNPEALAAVVKELKRETEALKVGIWLLGFLILIIFNDSYFFHFRLQLDTIENKSGPKAFA